MNDRVLVWDLPLRIFHWVLAASFAGAFLTAESERLRDVHVLCGYTFAGAIAFRVVWGFAGTRHARFSALRFRPAAILRELQALVRGRPQRHVGHGPIGAVMIPLLLGLGAVVAASGWATYAQAGEWLEELHEGAAVAMLVVVIGHVVGVVATSVLSRENLVVPLLTGRKPRAAGGGIASSRPLVALLLLAALAALWVPGLAARDERLAERRAHVAELGGGGRSHHGD
ncbi:MAG: cytochrome B [Proteobacteria bacterium]|nr:MAG: cytochrome B [Pseudomonadota bacterium]